MLLILPTHKDAARNLGRFKLHFTYMNFTGESYTMMFRNGSPWTPKPGQLPHALQVIPAHQVQFKLSKEGYSKSTVKYQGVDYPLSVFVRDINPDPSSPMYGQSIITSAASIINSDMQMRDWNNNLIANGARPSLIFSTNPKDGSWMPDGAWERFKAQFEDQHQGSMNAGKPLLIENGDAKPFMLSPQDLDFLNSRKFSRDEILAMWRVSPYIIGSVEDVNQATAKAAWRQHAEINIDPRVRQYLRQLNATFVRVFDESLWLEAVNVIPEDDEAKLKYVTAGTNKWLTIDEARNHYGEEALPNKLGEQIYLPSTNAPLKSIADGSAKPEPPAADPANADGGDEGTDDPEKDGKKLFVPSGVKKKT